MANVGEIQNSGFEITLNTINILRDNFKWSSDINFSHNKDEVIKLAGGLMQDIGNNRFVGESVLPLYTWEFEGIWQMDQAEEAAIYGQVPGEVRLVDQNEDSLITDEDRKIIGSETPDWLMGIRNQFTYRNFDFSFFIYTRQGVMYNNEFLKATYGEIGSDRYNRSAEINYWTSSNPSNTYFGLLGAGLESNPKRGNTRVALQHQKANFVRVSDITLGYSLPESLLKRMSIKDLRVYAQIQNPFLFTDMLTFNPEYNSGGDDDDIPFTVYLFGLNVSF